MSLCCYTRNMARANLYCSPPFFSTSALFLISRLTSTFDNGSPDPDRKREGGKERNRRKQKPRRRRGSEDRFTARGAQGWTSEKKVGLSRAQLPLGTCSARRYLRAILLLISSFSHRATWRVRGPSRPSFLNTRDEKRERRTPHIKVAGADRAGRLPSRMCARCVILQRGETRI